MHFDFQWGQHCKGDKYCSSHRHCITRVAQIGVAMTRSAKVKISLRKMPLIHFERVVEVILTLLQLPDSFHHSYLASRTGVGRLD